VNCLTKKIKSKVVDEDIHTHVARSATWINKWKRNCQL